MRKHTIITAMIMSLLMAFAMIPSFSFAAGHALDSAAVNVAESGDVMIEPGDEDGTELIRFMYEEDAAVMLNGKVGKASVSSGDTSAQAVTVMLFDVTASEDGTESEILVDERSVKGGDIFVMCYGPASGLKALEAGHEYEFRARSNNTSYYFTEYDFKQGTSGFSEEIYIDDEIEFQAGISGVAEIITDEYNTVPAVTDVRSSDTGVMKVTPSGDSFEYECLKRGKTTITMKLVTGSTVSETVSVANGVPTLYSSSVRINRGKTFQNKILYNDNKVTWSTTNKRVAKVSRKGLITAVEPGHCTIKAKCAGQIVTCEVEVYRLDPEYQAAIAEYSNSGKWIKVKVTNNGSKSLTVFSAKAAYTDNAGKSHARSLKFAKGKSTAIAAGATKTIKFKIVKGTFKWNPLQSDGASVKFRFKYDGKKYDGKAVN
ncbi:MAG: Ig-like domain-containing protein [Bacillota bacterium]|nr:Ig-like domain-containing protein [Bacillota bacterium]